MTKNHSAKISGLHLLLLATLSSASIAAAQNLVANGGFETGSFSSWTWTGNTGSTTVGGEFAHTGGFGAKLGPVGSDGFLSQSLATTPGTLYDLSFWLKNGGGGPNDFTVTFGGATPVSLLNEPPFAYTEYTFSGLAGTGNSTFLQFAYRQDPVSWNLDDISVTVSEIQSAPEPSTWVVACLGTAVLVLRISRPRRGTHAQRSKKAV